MIARIKGKSMNFEPFTLEIRVENIDEARYLYHLFNQSTYSSMSDVDDEYHPAPDLDKLGDKHGVWNVIDEQIKPFEIKDDEQLNG